MDSEEFNIESFIDEDGHISPSALAYISDHEEEMLQDWPSKETWKYIDWTEELPYLVADGFVELLEDEEYGDSGNTIELNAEDYLTEVKGGEVGLGSIYIDVMEEPDRKHRLSLEGGYTRPDADELVLALFDLSIGGYYLVRAEVCNDNDGALYMMLYFKRSSDFSTNITADIIQCLRDFLVYPED